jgi:ketosteroid isomerase-like protein
VTAASESQWVATRFFNAIERGEIDEVRAIYAPNAVIWHNTDGTESTVAENLEVLTSFVRRIRQRRYENRRIEVFPSGFVQQHLLTGVRADGVRLQLPACVICQVANGRITRLDEYFDTAAVAPWMVEFPPQDRA